MIIEIKRMMGDVTDQQWVVNLHDVYAMRVTINRSLEHLELYCHGTNSNIDAKDNCFFEVHNTAGKDGFIGGLVFDALEALVSKLVTGIKKRTSVARVTRWDDERKDNDVR